MLTADDEVVESSSVFVLELSLSGAPNERISIEPSQTTLTVLDNDSRFMYCLQEIFSGKLSVHCCKPCTHALIMILSIYR